jgi:hypothetical protein
VAGRLDAARGPVTLPVDLPDPADTAALADARARVIERIGGACERAGRDPSSVQLVAVSKTVPVARLRAAVAAGHDRFGENRVQEAASKVALVPGASWHLVGPLQGNKARRAVELFGTIETVDSLALAARLDRIVRELRALPAAGPVGSVGRLRVLLQVNVDGDPAKAGFAPAALAASLAALAGLDALELAGLMTIGRLGATAEEARPTFRALRRLAAGLRADAPGLGPELSMGMSDDFEVAVEEGATIVRVGRALFGERVAPARPRGDAPGSAAGEGRDR